VGAGLAVVVSAGWFIALVGLWPAADRPYIGGSTDNSLLQLALGYNGLGRIFGGSGNSGLGGGGGGGNANFGGPSGLGRMFGASFGTEISWLLPAALIGLVAGLWFARHAPRTDRTRAALVLWGGWLVVTALVFSFMSGTIHPYYAVALAPAIVALVVIAGRELWRGRENLSSRAVLASMIVVTAVWDFILLDRTSSWLPELRWAIAVLGVLAATAVLMGVHQFKKAMTAMAVVTVLTLGIGSTAYAVDTASQAHTGAVPTSGPSVGGMGGRSIGGDGSASSVVGTLLSQTTTKWAAATTGSKSAASLELASGKAVIGIGGWDGSDPAPTLDQFKQYVADKQVHYFVAGGGFGGGSGSSGSIADWVAANFPATTVDGQTIYDLTA
jgi:4-amino-4-deoxy-L-arabinose transferase-like glycosyltransferase